jgi:hypothetical protein
MQDPEIRPSSSAFFILKSSFCVLHSYCVFSTFWSGPAAGVGGAASSVVRSSAAWAASEA